MESSMTDREGGLAVIGGGIAGITAAVEAAEAGQEVFLVEREHTLGGRVLRMNEYFPKMCPPPCGLEINLRRLRQSRRVKVFTGARVLAVRGGPGAYQLEVELAPRLVSDACTLCGDCVAACPVEREDSWNYGLGTTRAIYLPSPYAWPPRYAIDPQACPGSSCARCLPHCPVDAIHLEEKPRRIVLPARAVVVATGWKPYDARRLDLLGFGRLPDVVTNVMLERLASRGGPSGGKIQRPSDGTPPRRVAFVQCAGSRDENHLPYCSAVCCAATLKQVTYLRRSAPETEVKVFYIDLRTVGFLESLLSRAEQDEKLELVRGKVARVEAGPAGSLRVTAEDTLSGVRREEMVDLVVLATGIEPESRIEGVPYDAHGFIPPGEGSGGLLGAGCARRPAEVVTSVQDATAAAARALGAMRS
jgi:quinone-modifying oxidoreductase subunit QmoA